MRANNLVDIQELVDVDDWENETETWETVDQSFAEIVPLSGRELVDSRQVHADITHKLKMPWKDNITADMRIKWGSRVFHLLGPPINKKEGNRWIELMCQERT